MSAHQHFLPPSAAGEEKEGGSWGRRWGGGDEEESGVGGGGTRGGGQAADRSAAHCLVNFAKGVGSHLINIERGRIFILLCKPLLLARPQLERPRGPIDGGGRGPAPQQEATGGLGVRGRSFARRERLIRVSGLRLRPTEGCLAFHRGPAG